MFYLVFYCADMSTPERHLYTENETLTEEIETSVAEHPPTSLSRKSGKQVANQLRGKVGKNDARYWLSRIFRPVNDRGIASPHFSMKVQFKGQRMAFTLGTSNKDAASRKAADIYLELLKLGTEAVLASHRAKSGEKRDGIATVGEWIVAAKAVSEANPATFNCYAASLRLIVGQILDVKKSRTRFGPRKGGASAYRASVDAASLEILSLPAVQKWRLAYVAQAKNPVQERSRMTSCNSTIRQARSLFAGKVVKFLAEVRLPVPLPFAGVEFFPKQNARYFSRIDPKDLLQTAHADLAKNDPPAFLAMLLALSAGLRRGEIDSLCWHQVDFTRELLRIENTEAASLKTRDSRDEVPIDPHVVVILRGFHAKASGPFVIEAAGDESGPRTWGHHYRADSVFTRLNAWLRAHGVAARKPIHELRKELGALVTAEHGIYAASRVLRHSNVATTAAHYSDLKTRPVVNIGGWLTPDNVIVMQPAIASVALQKKGRKKA